MTVTELNKLCKEQEVDTPLLSSGAFDFWAEYVLNHDILDNLFVKMYKNMHYFAEGDFTSKEDELADWLYTVESLLYANSKKYHELWRIQGIEDDKLSMTDNYNMTRSTTSNRQTSGAITSGQRSDYTDDRIGNQDNTTQEESSAMNSAGYHQTGKTINKSGTRNDTSLFTKGQETDTSVSQNTETITSHDVGNLGIQTGADVLKSYDDAINKNVFAFYQKVFNDICKEFLIWEV